MRNDASCQLSRKALFSSEISTERLHFLYGFRVEPFLVQGSTQNLSGVERDGSRGIFACALLNTFSDVNANPLTRAQGDREPLKVLYLSFLFVIHSRIFF